MGNGHGGRDAHVAGGRGIHGGLLSCHGDSHGTFGDGKMEHLGDARHLGVVELVSRALKHALGRNAAEVVFKDELAREGGALLGGASTVDHHVESVGVGWVT